MEKGREARGENKNCPELTLQACATAPKYVTAATIDQRATCPPQSERPAIRQARKWREQHRHLRRIQRQILQSRSFGHLLPRQGRLRVHVIQIGATMRVRQQSQGIKVHKICSLELPVAVMQARSRDDPSIPKPQTQGEDHSMRAQAPRREPSACVVGDCHSFRPEDSRQHGSRAWAANSLRRIIATLR